MSEAPRTLHIQPKNSRDRLTDAQVDGPIDIVSSEMPARRRRLPGDVCAIFVHAGAGYHSLQNEKIHLEACEDAAKSAMTFLNNGGSAVDAVEIAIKVLEDKEITNAGFGSNLAMNGTVECDATIVDHYGRSGAVGAVGCIRNPIHLARATLEHSTQPLSLRRVPPNLLVGAGAIDFADQVEVPVVHPDVLVSPAAGERYNRWKADLSKVSAAEESEVDDNGYAPVTRKEIHELEKKREAQDHELAPCWNESQPYSPRLTATDPLLAVENRDSNTDSEAGRKCNIRLTNEPGNDGQESLRSLDDDEEGFIDDNVAWPHYKSTATPVPYPRPLGGCYSDNISEQNRASLLTLPTPPTPTRAETPSRLSEATLDGCAESSGLAEDSLLKADDITDTVGAIAIDCLGNIAAGSSSGGIGMKHKGRVGPAALVGIGTAVVPIEPEDPEKTCVATVTSGTGEHMATTMAAGTCANRLYSSSHRSKNGCSEYINDDDRVIRLFVEREFMGHPSVKHSHSAGAIGILGVKKTTSSVRLYFAHNTDSFAVASMAGDDKEPRSVMSRNKSENQVITGGRSVRHHRWTRGTWPANPDEKRDPDSESMPEPKRQKTKRVSRRIVDRMSSSAHQPIF